LLEQAVQKENSLERLLYATAFTCASYCGSIHRDAKPFNPLLGETYEFQDDRSWFLAEQVGETSHISFCISCLFADYITNE